MTTEHTQQHHQVQLLIQSQGVLSERRALIIYDQTIISQQAVIPFQHINQSLASSDLVCAAGLFSITRATMLAS